MSRIITNLVLIFILTTTTSQILCAQGNYRRVKFYYENSLGETGLSTYYFDQNGISQRSKWELLDGSRGSENYHTIDDNGNMIRKYREFTDSLTSDNYFFYNDEGNLIGEKFERSDGIKGETTYFYENGKKIKADCKGHNGWLHAIINYKYENEILTNAEILYDGKNAGSIIYEYDEYGNLVKEFWDFNGRWTQTMNYEYEKYEINYPVSFTSSNVFITNTNNYRMTLEKYDYNNQNGGPSYFEYDETGRLIKKTFVRSDDFKTETTFEFDDKGILLTSHRVYSNGETADFVYTFNGNRKLSERSYSKSDGKTGNEKYEYDPKGNLVTAYYNNFDSWLNGTIEFTHDEKGNLKSGKFIADEGYTADIHFYCDGNNNIIKIHWDFSFGKTQTYWFEFEKI